MERPKHRSGIPNSIIVKPIRTLLKKQMDPKTPQLLGPKKIKLAKSQKR